jgi:hypothetical protein
MSRRLLTILLALSVVVSACSNLGLGEADCTPPERDVSSSNFISFQAVPTAKYIPCLNELRLGWSSVAWFAEDGKAGIEIRGGVEAFEAVNPFLTATVTASCDTSRATPQMSGREDIRRFEEITDRPLPLGITLIPIGELALFEALDLAGELIDTRLEDRDVKLVVDDSIEEAVTDRLDRALDRNQFVWIIDELGAQEGTVELRSNDPNVAGRGLSPKKALDEIEDHLPDLRYRGKWYFTFEGGCITYEFDAEGSLAETVAADATDALGFYPAYKLRDFVEGAGYDIIDD